MSDVAKKLAAATCEAAPYGWSDRDSNGRQIVDVEGSQSVGWIGHVDIDGDLWHVMWDETGVTSTHGGADLVPLPAPAPERLTSEELENVISWTARGSDTHKIARELIDARKTIADLKSAEIEWQKLDAMRCDKIAGQAAEIQAHEANNSGLSKTIDALRIRVTDLEDVGKLWEKRRVEMEAEIERLTRERDAAITLARCLRNRLAAEDPTVQFAVVQAFDERYGNPACPPCDPPPTCDHDWHSDEDLPLTEKACSKCGAIGKTCQDCGGVCLEGCGCDDWGMVVVPTCEPIEPTTGAVEYVRSSAYPTQLFRPVSIDRDVDGSILQIDCGSVVLSVSRAFYWEAKIGGQWRAI